MVSGSWKITVFSENGNDKTSHFSGYNFTFGSDNYLIADNGTNSYAGIWSVTTDDSSDDDHPSGDIDFNILFSVPDSFTGLNEDWHIVHRTSTKLSLEHISGGNGGTDTLVFEKD